MCIYIYHFTHTYTYTYTYTHMYICVYIYIKQHLDGIIIYKYRHIPNTSNDIHIPHTK